MNRYEVKYTRILPDGTRYPVRQTITANSESEAWQKIQRMDVNPVILDSIRRV